METHYAFHVDKDNMDGERHQTREGSRRFGEEGYTVLGPGGTQDRTRRVPGVETPDTHNPAEACEGRVKEGSSDPGPW